MQSKRKVQLKFRCHFQLAVAVSRSACRRATRVLGSKSEWVKNPVNRTEYSELSNALIWLPELLSEKREANRVGSCRWLSDWQGNVHKINGPNGPSTRTSFFSHENYLHSACRSLEDQNGTSALPCTALRCNGPTALQFKPFKNLSKYLENEGGQRIEENKYKQGISLFSISWGISFSICVALFTPVSVAPKWTLHCDWDSALAPKCDKMSVFMSVRPSFWLPASRSYLIPSLSAWPVLKIGPFIVVKCSSSLSLLKLGTFSWYPSKGFGSAFNKLEK